MILRHALMAEGIMRVLILVLIVAVAGCASFQNTPAQDQVWNAYRACQTETGSNVVIQYVYPDGRWTGWCPDLCTRMPELRNCISEKVRA